MTSARSITIVGLGLMGGSLARALARLPDPPLLTLVDADAHALDALRDLRHRSLHSALSDAPSSDLLVLAAPLSHIIETLRAGDLGGHAAITDLGSVKAAPLAAAGAGGVTARYAGSHPMCGDHRSGYGAARADLYAGCTVYVTVEGGADAGATVASMWQSLDAHVVSIGADVHDELVAKISHLPQVVASVLAATLAGSGVVAGELGPGGRDTTRISASDPQLWTDILLHNHAAVREVLARFGANLDAVHRHLANGDAEPLRRMLKRGSEWRRNAP